MIIVKRFFTILVVLAALCSCQDASSSSQFTTQATPTLVSPAAGYGGITGTVQGGYGNGIWKGKKIFAYAAPFSGDAMGEGIYILDSTLPPQSEIQANGIFYINNVKPGSYVLVIGPTTNDARAALDEGKPYVFQVMDGAVEDLGPIIIQP